ncbi:uncharacterized protein MAM_05435 [Metarhizium album ARSEF 1941]|uniref:Uncharacterized protein n=1 Tax=Metarhizium album (strain ARSEF 1941) TaxID=1081103 RepID=A0A0B2WTA5_METAS|nr:uncharacterized protein MAM_05435 [Metarhizium album ARSEF 1941]KHN96879.1 hypothetical protein MAM_05435 [Metarhizium album ARSEF 1941]
MVGRHDSLNSLGPRVGFKFGGSDGQFGAKKAKDDTAQGIQMTVGPDGVVNLVPPVALPNGGLEALDGSSNGRYDGSQSARKGQRPNDQGVCSDGQYPTRPQSNGQPPASATDRLQLTFVTVNVQSTAARASAETETQLPSVVTTTVTVTGGANLPLQAQKSQNSSFVVSSETALPKTTRGLTGPPFSPVKLNTGSSLPPMSAPAATAKWSQPAAPEPEAQLRNGALLSSKTASSIRNASTARSSGSSNMEGQASHSAVAPAATTLAEAVAPVQPIVNLSGLTLKSVIDLGNLAEQTEKASATTSVLL